MTAGKIRKKLSGLDDNEEILIYHGQGWFSLIKDVNKQPVSKVCYKPTGRIGYNASDSYENHSHDVEVLSTKDMTFFIREL